MAVNKRGRHYKMTPRRKAALAKAQAVSARKRRRRGVALAGVLGATLVAGGAAYAGRSYVKKIASGGPKKHSTALVHVPGLGVTHTQMKRTVIPQGWGKPGPDHVPLGRAAKTTPKTVFKVSAKGVVTRTTKTRMKYDTNRRRSYWQAKPVGGAPRKKYTSLKRGR